MARLFVDEPLSEALCELIQLGDCSTDDIAQLLRRRQADIIRFNEDDEATVLELR